MLLKNSHAVMIELKISLRHQGSMKFKLLKLFGSDIYVVNIMKFSQQHLVLSKKLVRRQHGDSALSPGVIPRFSDILGKNLLKVYIKPLIT